ncbi:MAG: phage scaffolding protein [Oscillospiraceae bacterium]|nr:phage scaffolding protein [Oscillospiraceae bacterium]
MKREFLQNLKVGEQGLPKEIIDAIMEENGKDVQGARAWQEKYNQAVAQHQKELSDITFQSQLDLAILQAKGRSPKAITALLDLEALKKSENRQSDVEEALLTLKKESGYLFESDPTPPPYARGTGAFTGTETKAPATLAGALKERFEKERK